MEANEVLILTPEYVAKVRRVQLALVDERAIDYDQRVTYSKDLASVLEAGWVLEADDVLANVGDREICKTLAQYLNDAEESKSGADFMEYVSGLLVLGGHVLTTD